MVLLSGQTKDKQGIATAALLQFRGQVAVGHAASGGDCNVLHAVDTVRDGKPTCGGIEQLFPQHLTGFGVKGAEAARIVGDENQAAAGSQY